MDCKVRYVLVYSRQKGLKRFWAYLLADVDKYLPKVEYLELLKELGITPDSDTQSIDRDAGICDVWTFKVTADTQKKLDGEIKRLDELIESTYSCYYDIKQGPFSKISIEQEKCWYERHLMALIIIGFQIAFGLFLYSISEKEPIEANSPENKIEQRKVINNSNVIIIGHERK